LVSENAKISGCHVCRFLNDYGNEDKATYKMDARWS
jgi:hypothetical protein